MSVCYHTVLTPFAKPHFPNCRRIPWLFMQYLRLELAMDAKIFIWVKTSCLEPFSNSYCYCSTISSRRSRGNRLQYDVEAKLAQFKEYWVTLATFVIDAVEFIKDAQGNQAKILDEGSQALRLDIDFGTYPYDTSSNAGLGWYRHWLCSWTKDHQGSHWCHQGVSYIPILWFAIDRSLSNQTNSKAATLPELALYASLPKTLARMEQSCRKSVMRLACLLPIDEE